MLELKVLTCNECRFSKPDILLDKFWCNNPNRKPFLVDGCDYCSASEPTDGIKRKIIRCLQHPEIVTEKENGND